MIRTPIPSLVQPPAPVGSIMNSWVRIIDDGCLDIVTSIGSRINYKPVDAQPRSLWFQRAVGNL